MLPLAVLLCLGLVPLGHAGYVLQDDYSTNNFFSMFDFFTVRWKDQIKIQRDMLIMPRPTIPRTDT
jgi:hypothetical protein